MPRPLPPAHQRTTPPRRRWLVACAVLATAAVVALPGNQMIPTAAAQAPAPAAGYRFIAHPTANPAPVDRAFVAQAFLRKVRTWPDGQIIHPVDLGPNAPIRQQVSREVFGRSVAGVKSYWQQMIFSGRSLPPPELGSEDEVVAYVLRHPGSIGYVSAKTALRGALAVSFK